MSKTTKKVTANKKTTKKVTKKKTTKKLSSKEHNLQCQVNKLQTKVQELTDENMKDLSVINKLNAKVLELKGSKTHLLNIIRSLELAISTFVNESLTKAADMIMIQRDVVDNVCTEGPFTDNNSKMVDAVVSDLYDAIHEWNERERIMTNDTMENVNTCEREPIKDEGQEAKQVH